MVSCKYCVKKGLVCKMSSLKVQCGNCYKNGISKCEPVEPVIPNFSRIDSEVDRLEKLEEAAAAEEEAAIAALQAARAKRNRLLKQKRLLKERENKLLEDSMRFVEEIEHLEGLEDLGQDVAQLENGLMPGALALDWSSYPPPMDPDALDLTGEAVVSRS